LPTTRKSGEVEPKQINKSTECASGKEETKHEIVILLYEQFIHPLVGIAVEASLITNKKL
jgi:hypothetical protein